MKFGSILAGLLCLGSVYGYLPRIKSYRQHVGHPSSLPIKKGLLSTIRDENEFFIDENELVKRINDEIFAMDGVGLEDLINPSKVVNFERELLQIDNDMKTLAASNPNAINTPQYKQLEEKVEKIQKKLSIEKRAVMKGWLKNLFVIQSVIAVGISLAMVYDVVPGFPALPLSIKVLGFWMWWLFIIPSLRARKPAKEEKEALNLAFLLSPLASVAMPFVTKDVITIWWVNALVTGLCYVYAYAGPKTEEEASAIEDENDSNGTSSILKKAFKALDYGSGQERGLRK